MGINYFQSYKSLINSDCPTMCWTFLTSKMFVHIAKKGFSPDSPEWDGNVR